VDRGQFVEGFFRRAQVILEAGGGQILHGARVPGKQDAAAMEAFAGDALRQEAQLPRRGAPAMQEEDGVPARSKVEGLGAEEDSGLGVAGKSVRGTPPFQASSRVALVLGTFNRPWVM
jgi:hypothetical protein